MVDNHSEGTLIDEFPFQKNVEIHSLVAVQVHSKRGILLLLLCKKQITDLAFGCLDLERELLQCLKWIQRSFLPTGVSVLEDLVKFGRF